MNWYQKSIAETEQTLSTNIHSGLTDKESKKRQQTYGLNILTREKPPTLCKRFLCQFKDFMILTLIGAATLSLVVSFFSNDADFVDPIIIIAIVLLNAVVGVLWEFKAERSLEALKTYCAPMATVMRGGKKCVISSQELVPGDIIYLEAGHTIPADGRIVHSAKLGVEESSLTGESLPVHKFKDTITNSNVPLGDQKNMVMAGSMVISGHGIAIVTATGMHTQLGKIAAMIHEDAVPATPLQKRLQTTGKILGIICLVICVLIFILGIVKGQPFFEMFMTAVSLAVAAIPEGLPAIVTIMLSLGVIKMAKRSSVIRKLPAVETLGSSTYICSDKTGTLTQNKMTVITFSGATPTLAEDKDFANRLFLYASLCNNDLDPTESALVNYAEQLGMNKHKEDLKNPRTDEIPFDSTRKMMTTIHKTSNGLLTITKGAPDVLLRKCTSYDENGVIHPMTSRIRSSITAAQREYGSHAYRCIAVGYKNSSKSPERDMTFLGIIAMVDPPREEAFEAVGKCITAGIVPVMITGDHRATACAIAKELGILKHEKEAITGTELSELSDEQFAKEVHRYRVYSRVSPADKVRIVKALQENGEIVAMTGDGVNDAPALKSADIGCAMGKSGTDVAKNAADMILTDDNFATIVDAVQCGRGIYDNIRKAIHFLLSCNIGEIMTIFISILFGLVSPLLPVQLLFVNLVTDSLPAISIGTEPAEPYIMNRKPIPPSKGMFADGLLFTIVLEGMVIGTISLLGYLIGGGTMCFAILAISQLFHAYNVRCSSSFFTTGLHGNPRLLLSTVFCLALQVAVIMHPLGQMIFHTVALTLNQWMIVLALSLIPCVIKELNIFLRSHTKDTII